MNQPLPILMRGTGSYLPDEILDNSYFESLVDTSDEWIVTRTGIRERRRAAPDETTSTMGALAARRALEDAGMGVEQIDAIVCGTATGDHAFPATAAFIQSHLGAKNVMSYDVAGACAGFVLACSSAAGLLMMGMARNVLVVGAECLTRFSDPMDRTTTILFGDGAGAAVLSRTNLETDRGILFQELGTAGEKADLIRLPGGGSKMPYSEQTLAERGQYLHMKGREVFKFAVVKMSKLIDNALKKLEIVPDDLAMVIPHQSNLRIIESVRERLDLPWEKFAVNIDRYGNTSAASIPVALDEARRAGRLKEGDLALMVAIGAGLTWGTLVIRL